MNAARIDDLVLQFAPHCHAPIHPAALTPTPTPHPPRKLAIKSGQKSVLIGGSPAARLTDVSDPCGLNTCGCLAGGPGIITKASRSVYIGGLPAARVGDITTHAACVAPIPSPTGSILPPGCKTVIIGG